MNERIDTSLFDRATALATEAHSSTQRRGKGFPYIIHPMEAATIVSTITNDPEMLAAAIMHDVVEDTDISIDRIKAEFGERIAKLVQHDTSPMPSGSPWRLRRQSQLDQLTNAPLDSKIVAIGDKLSNLRGISNDYKIIGDKLWSRFHAPGGKTDIEWYYRGLATALFDLSETLPYQEFIALLEQTFGAPSFDNAYPIDINDYEESGGGFFTTSYNHKNGTTMAKFYHPKLGINVPAQELRHAYAVMRMGIPTPMPGRLICNGDSYGAEFRRISPKQSFARYISNHPDSYEEIARLFAKMCLELHNTPCNTISFTSEKEHILADIEKSRLLNDKLKDKCRAIVYNTPDCTTCLHGDMHIGNVITTMETLPSPQSQKVTNSNFWIDLGDFRWGHPLFDLGMFYMTSHWSNDTTALHIFHLNMEMMQKTWNAFIRAYYNTDDDTVVAAKEEQIKPYAILKIIHFGNIQDVPPFTKAAVLQELEKL